MRARRVSSNKINTELTTTAVVVALPTPPAPCLVLTVLADVIGVASGWYFAMQVLPITNSDFSYGARAFWRDFDAYYSVIKAFAFAVSIAVTSTYMGFSTQQGAEGVGKATTTAVVVSSVLILLLDTLLARVLLHG